MSGPASLQHPRFARCYLTLSAKADDRGGLEHRARLLAGLAGRVIEIGAGNGRNFPHYPVTVTEVLAVEPDDILRAHAQAAAATAPVPVKVAAGHASALPAGDGSFDAAIASLVLCSAATLTGTGAVAAAASAWARRMSSGSTARTSVTVTG